MYQKINQFKFIISTVIVFALFFIGAAVSHAATITVDTTTGVAGVDTFCNLEEAIDSFNGGTDLGECVADITEAYGVNDTIEFGIGAPADTSTQIITDADAQYIINVPITINGLTQGNATCGVSDDLSDRDLDIQMNGIELAFMTGSDGSVVTGISILGGESYPAIGIDDVDGFDLTCSNIGIDAAGTGANVTRADVLGINDSSNVTIGDAGLAIGDTNIFAGGNDRDFAASVSATNVDNLSVYGNWFGYGVGPSFTEFPAEGEYIDIWCPTECGQGPGLDYSTNVIIASNGFKGDETTDTGLYLNSVGGITISDNMISGFAETAIDINEATNVDIIDNHLFENLRTVIGLDVVDAGSITGNYIGTDETGMFSRGNSTLAPSGSSPNTGIALLGVTNMIIGGDEASERNIISGNDSVNFATAIAVIPSTGSGQGSENVAIQGNYIGVAADGTTALSNSSMTSNIAIMGDEILVGGTGPGEGNTIQGGANGVLVFTLNVPFPAQNMTFIGNSIYNVSGSGIEIAYDSDLDFFMDTLTGPNPNDPLDTDTGPYVGLNPANNLNELLNYPEIELVATYEGVGGPEAWVAYSLDVPAGDYRIEFFRNSEFADYGPGEEMVGLDNITHAGAGSELFFTRLREIDPGDFISATATEENLATATGFGATSEFSETVTAVDLVTDTMTTLPASGISQTSATINAQQSIYIPFLGGTGFFIGETSISEPEDFFEYDMVLGPIGLEDIDEETGEFSVNLASFDFDSELVEITELPLDCGTTYYARALGVFDPAEVAATSFGDEISFTTSSCTTDSPRRRSSSTPQSKAKAQQAFENYYAEQEPTNTPSNNNSPDETSTLNSGQCPANLIVTQNLKRGAIDGQYHSYAGENAQEVALVQAHINRILANYYDQAAGPVDGIFGPLTKQGVQRLQETLRDEQGANLGPAGTDGIVGPMTRAAINGSCGEEE
jgi:hypothetical protein